MPFGRLQPYIAAGPAIFFTSQTPTINIGNSEFSPNAKDNVDLGFAVETGLRYFFTKSISAEASFKYRMVSVSSNFSQRLLNTNVNLNVDTKADFYLSPDRSVWLSLLTVS